MIALAAAMLLQAAPAPIEAVPTADAINYFRRLCVETMPDPAQFSLMMARDIAWEPIEQSAGGAPGNAWRSPRGMLAYRYLPAPGNARAQTCSYGFRTSAAYSQADAAAQLASALELGGGEGPWETRLSNGARVRIAIAAGAEGISDPAATLSISAFPVADAGE
jgi:hypothetical protein